MLYASDLEMSLFKPPDEETDFGGHISPVVASTEAHCAAGATWNTNTIAMKTLLQLARV